MTISIVIKDAQRAAAYDNAGSIFVTNKGKITFFDYLAFFCGSPHLVCEIMISLLFRYF